MNTPKKRPKKRTAAQPLSRTAGSVLTFQQGYVCACANLLNMHGDSTLVRDLVQGYGPIDWATIDPYDRETLAAYVTPPNKRNEDWRK
jgi:hypothetical protein